MTCCKQLQFIRFPEGGGEAGINSNRVMYIYEGSNFSYTILASMGKNYIIVENIKHGITRKGSSTVEQVYLKSEPSRRVGFGMCPEVPHLKMASYNSPRFSPPS